MKHTDKPRLGKRFKVLLYASPIAIIILLLLFFSIKQANVEEDRYYCVNGEIWNWQLTLSGKGSFFLDNASLSCFFDEPKQYEYKDDMLILEYLNGMKLYFKVNADADTLTYQENLSYIPRELTNEVYSRIPADKSVFYRYYKDK